MTSIRLSTRRLPSCQEVLESSSLPLACVLTPLSETAVKHHRPPLTSIPKCPHCGAPHPDALSHDRFASTLSCHLCGNESELEEYQTSTTAELTVNSKTHSEHQFALPLRLPNQPHRMHANACPPLWFLLLDGSMDDAHYWKTVSDAIDTALARLPPFVHISILISFSTDTNTLGVLQLDCPSPHIRYIDSSAPEELLLVHIMEGLVPADAAHRAHMQTALRSLMDFAPPSDSRGIPLHWTCSAIVAALQELGQAAGEREPSHFPYAGAKLTVLPGRRFAGLSNRIRRSTAGATVGGRVAVEPGTRYGMATKPAVDLTAEGLEAHYQPLSDNDYAALGEDCAAAAMSVDIICLLLRESLDDSVPDFGLALVGALSDTSGAPGPVLVDQLKDELYARAPVNMCFGVDLRLRLAPGYTVLTDDTHPRNKRGLSGPGYAVSDQLWRLGTCDQFVSVAVDLGVSGGVHTGTKKVLQSCVAYTSIEQEGDEYFVVRRMRVSIVQATVAPTVENLFGSLDPEVLAVVLFHKLALACYEEGDVLEIAHEWLTSLLTCAYRSAEDQELLEQDDKKFDAGKRLLGRNGGELPDHEILLAAGHSRLRPISLLIYLLLQSDGLSLAHADFQPSVDQRYCALAQMSSMTPSTLTRCIAPRLQIWESGSDSDEPLIDVVDLRSEEVQLAVLECGAPDKAILMIDTPSQLVILDARYVNSVPEESSKLKSLVMGKGLEQVIQETLESYRVPPEIVYEIDQSGSSGEHTFAYLMDALIEDAPLSSEHDSFAAWRIDVANWVQETLDSEE